MRKELLIFTGAGVSKESGIPTFAELGDARMKLSRSFFRKHPAELYDILLQLYEKLEAAVPNPAHEAIAQGGFPVITMNVDGLHRKAGTKDLIEIHGNLEKVNCPHCDVSYDFHDVKYSIHCPKCKNILEPNVVLYEDALPGLNKAFEWVDSTDALLIIGTSFYTSTSSYIVDRAKGQGKQVNIINENAVLEVPRFLSSIL